MFARNVALVVLASWSALLVHGLRVLEQENELSHTEDTGRSDAIRAAMEEVLAEVTLEYNLSLSAGYADKAFSFGMAAGTDDKAKGTPLLAETPIPLGSVTKPWTAVQLLQAVEAGKLSLDDKASTWIDPVLRHLMQETLESLWGPKAADVKVIDLIGMSSGFADYDDESMENFTRTQGRTADVDPMSYIRSAATTGWICDPGTCTTYSGANYVLAGFVLMQLQGLTAWEALDQMSVIPVELRVRYSNTQFAMHGPCTSYPGAAHYYANYPRGDQEYVQDMAYLSCLNGWTMGNIMSTGKDLAQFFFDLFDLAPTGRGFVNATTLALMRSYKPMPDAWCRGPTGPGSCTYGYGFQLDETFRPMVRDEDQERSIEVKLEGHGGQNWGSSARACGYNPHYAFALCVASTSLVGLNGTLDRHTNYYGKKRAVCLMYDAVLSVVGGPRLDCKLPAPKGPRVWPEFEWHFS